ncbi:MAG: homocysteine S-methyltransferase family protein [Clostridia bacterium]|nr:homocysteine S-methyltransferase family protein [Clostridia bacterium]
MKFINKLKSGVVVLDGAMGTQLQNAGLPLGELPEEWNLTHPQVIEDVHRAYLQAGADVIYANTFGANAYKFGDRTQLVTAAGVKIAKKAAKDYKNRYVALDIGPTGKLLKPLGDVDFEDAVNVFKRTILAGVQAGADLIAIETMNDTYELKAAMLAAKECCDLPVIVTCVFGEDCKMMTGASPEAVVALAESLGAAAVGLNCSLGPEQMAGAVKRFIACASIPVVVKPNAGLPEEVDGKTVYNVSADEFALSMQKILAFGARVVGGCCGTTPEYIAKLSAEARSVIPCKITDKNLTVISSYTHAVYFGGAPILIGERINPTGKKRLKQALKEGDMAYVLNEAVSQAEKGAHVLDVNVGLPEIDEPEVLTAAVTEIQSVTDLPLQIDTSDPAAMERALRRYNGKALVNSVNGKQEVMDQVFPLVQKYGGAVIALTLDEGGIPSTAQGRIAIAKKIIAEAAKYGIKQKDLIFDTLAMAVSADSTAPLAAIDALRYIRHTIGANTSLGVSNISFGLPNRDFVNGTFFAMALTSGLSAAIINPNSQEMIKTYKSFCALSGYDKNCLNYIEYASNVQAASITVSGGNMAETKPQNTLQYYVEKGLKAEAENAAAQLLKTQSPMDVINGEIIPALNEVGVKFENKTLFLPQLLMSAEAASGAFEVIKSSFGSGGAVKKLKIVIATVKGDIHDIGKNIVKTLLENYGFNVLDLGRDVPPQTIVDAAISTGAEVVGLSALMTTTVASMRDTIALLKEQYPECRTLVGGAVLNPEYAEMIGATKYAKDAMESVRYCEEVEEELYGKQPQ